MSTSATVPSSSLLAAASVATLAGGALGFSLAQAYLSSSRVGETDAETGAGASAASATNREDGKSGRPGDEGADSAPSVPRSGVRKQQKQPSCNERTLLHEDSLDYLAREGLPAKSFVLTALPDQADVRTLSPGASAWREWYSAALKTLLGALPEGCGCVLIETDVREANKFQESKLLLAINAASNVEGVSLLWHKVVHFGTVDEPSHGATKFSHLLCFARVPKAKIQPLSGGLPDILWRGLKPRGFKHAERCFGANVVREVLMWAKKRLPMDVVVDPFCGQGTVLAIANGLGIPALGIDVSPKALRQAKQLDGESLLAAEEDTVNLKDSGNTNKSASSRAQVQKLSARDVRRLRATGASAAAQQQQQQKQQQQTSSKGLGR